MYKGCITLQVGGSNLIDRLLRHATVSTRNLAIANRLRVSCEHSTSRASIVAA